MNNTPHGGGDDLEKFTVENGRTLRSGKRPDAQQSVEGNGVLEVSRTSEVPFDIIIDETGNTKGLIRRIDEIRGSLHETTKAEESPRLTEEPLVLGAKEATINDIPEIIVVYEGIIYLRELFVDLARERVNLNADPFLIDKMKAQLSEGGELFPISADEWERRIKEERVLVFRTPPDTEHLTGKIIAVHSYVLPVGEEDEEKNRKNREKIQTRIGKINERGQSEQNWFKTVENDGAEHILMTEDVFFAKDIRHKGLHFLIYQLSLQHELERGAIKREDIGIWSIYYWVNYFENVFMESLIKQSADKKPPQAFRVAPFNRAMVQATLKAGGLIIGRTHNPDKADEGWIHLPSAQDEKIPYEINGDRVCLIRPYLDVAFPVVKLIK